MAMATAAILTIGSELTEGHRLDTNSAEIAQALGLCGFQVNELVSVGDDIESVARAIERLTGVYSLVVTTGGLGPTHDDITREAAARALRTALVRDSRLESLLESGPAWHHDPEAARQVFAQADVLPGAEIIDATTGTAPGLVVSTSSGHLALLPGPPSEMRPMLAALAARYPARRSTPRELGVVGLSESDAQVLAQRALDDWPGVRLTVLARPGDVRVILFDEGAGEDDLTRAGQMVASALSDHCYSTTGETLAQALVRLSTNKGVSFSLAESCTGGLASAEVTAVPGASSCFRGGVVAYDDYVKSSLLGVDPHLLAAHGAVSDHVAAAMARGVRERTGSDIAAAITGIAGPGGGSADKPVGLVWFGIATRTGSRAVEQRFRASSRSAVRDRAVAFALNLIRGELTSG